MRVLLVTILSLSIQACGLPQGARRSTHEDSKALAQEPEPGSPFHSLHGWPETVKFYIAADAPKQIIEGAIRAAESWNSASGRSLLEYAGLTESKRDESLYGSLNDDLTVIYYEDHWKATTGKSDTTLATTVWENDGASDSIVKGDIIMNTEIYKFVDALEPSQDNRVKDLADAESVLLHELGHLLGLDHVAIEADSLSVMHAQTSIGPDVTFRILSEQDTANIRTLYP